MSEDGTENSGSHSSGFSQPDSQPSELVHAQTKERGVTSFSSSCGERGRKAIGFVYHIRDWLSDHKPFSFLVIYPTFLAFIYYIFIAAPQYVSESDFVVHGKGPSEQSFSLPTLFEGGEAAQENTYVVQDYMISRDAMILLREKDDLAGIFSRPEADFLTRYPAFYDKVNDEALYKVYKRHVSVDLDSKSGISTLKVRAFRPDDAQKLSQDLFAAAEALVNKINERQTANMTRVTRQEVEELEGRLKDIDVKLSQYRNKTEMLDPVKEAQPLLKSINQLQGLLLTSRMRLRQLEDATSSSPMIEPYKQHIRILEAEISAAKKNITGDQLSMVAKIEGYVSLITEKKITTRLLDVAKLGLQSAKAQAERQLIYVDLIVKPSLPDKPTYPRKTLMLFLIFVSLTSIYFIGKMLITSVKEYDQK